MLGCAAIERRTVFGISLAYLSVPLLLGLLLFIQHDWFAFLQDAFGPVPLGVPWFGALGAVLISLTGVFEHEKDWDKNYWHWHLARPLIGIVVAVVSVLIFKAAVLAVGTTPTDTPDTPDFKLEGETGELVTLVENFPDQRRRSVTCPACA